MLCRAEWCEICVLPGDYIGDGAGSGAGFGGSEADTHNVRLITYWIELSVEKYKYYRETSFEMPLEVVLVLAGGMRV